jgi:serine/threonine protein kinase
LTFANAILSSRNLERTFLAAGVEHRDIRPANVLRAADGTLRLIDFGYSMLVEPKTDLVH